MKIVVQRVSSANVVVDSKVVGKINKGFLLLVAVSQDDTTDDIDYCVRKVSGLRIFEDEHDKMNLSLKDVGGSILSISQFTLMGETRHGNRPSFSKAMKADSANLYFQVFNEMLRNNGFTVESGIFQTHMDVSLVNDGPVTIIIDSKER